MASILFPLFLKCKSYYMAGDSLSPLSRQCVNSPSPSYSISLLLNPFQSGFDRSVLMWPTPFPLPREPELVLMDIQSVPAGQEGWLAFDVTSASNRWLLHPRSNLGIRLYVETEEGELALLTTRGNHLTVPC